MEESFTRMRTEVMDLMQIHNLVDWRTHTTTLKNWKQRGRVRYIGITHYHEGAYDDLERLIKTRDYDFVQLNYSIAERDAERRVLPLAQQLGVAVIANRPFTRRICSPGARQATTRVGRRIRLQLLGAVLPEVHRVASGGDMRDSGNQQARTPEGQHARRLWQAS
jgi:aryl-alcohol dehydrogenase-like predicted oxidoreductase